MFALLFNLSLGELIAIGVVALLVFGSRLPEVAAQIAVQMQRARRSLQDLRRETGIDREMWEVRRRFEEAVPRDVESPSAALRQARLEAEQALRKPTESKLPEELLRPIPEGESPGPQAPPAPTSGEDPDDPETERAPADPGSSPSQ